MVELDALLARIHPVDAAVGEESQRIFDLKTKPRRSLGRLEDLATRIASIRGLAVPPRLNAAIVVAAGDHGVAAEGVSAYPQEVTAQMVANFGAGGARETAAAAVAAGATLAEELAREGVGIIGVGEMGIANTTSASALCAHLLRAEPSAVCGRGTGLDDEGVKRKSEVVNRMLAANDLDPDDPLGALAALGGFEVAVVVGLVLGCAAERVPVVLDGFITGAAALVAARLSPASTGAMIASHRSSEPGHRLVLEALGLDPLVDLGLRLGEGSGAALVLPLIGSAIALLNEMASFDAAGVTDAGR